MISPDPPNAFSRDTLFDGRLVLCQHSDGYRFSLDAVLLAHFVRPGQRARILDLGAGCGVVSLVLAFRHPSVQLTALELQPSLVSLVERNISDNHFDERIRALHGDLRRIRDVLAAGAFDLVVSNPPYRKVGSGRQNQTAEEAAARHEITADLDAVLDAAVFAVRTGGRAVFVYPAARAAALLAGLRQQNLEPKLLQVVYSYPGGPGRLVLVEAVKNGGEGLLILPPFFVYQRKNGEFSPEMASCYCTDPF